MTSHFVCVVVYRICPPNERTDGGVEFLVLDYRSTDPETGRQSELQTKFPGGTNREHPDEPVAITRYREIMKKTGLKIQSSKEIWRKEIGPEHTEYGFLVNLDDCRGGLRRMPIVDDGDELSTPYWVFASTLGRMSFHSHQEMYLQETYLAACRNLDVF